MGRLTDISSDLRDWTWWGDAYMANVWLYLLAKSDQETGEINVTFSGLATTLGISFQQVREALKRLETTNKITRKSTNKSTTLKVCFSTSYEMEILNNNKQKTNEITNEKEVFSPSPDNPNLFLQERKKEKEEINTIVFTKTEKDTPAAPSLEERRAKFVAEVYGYEKDYPREMLEKFISYWTEVNEGGRLMAWEKARNKKGTWSTGRRLSTWKQNNENRRPAQPSTNPLKDSASQNIASEWERFKF